MVAHDFADHYAAVPGSDSPIRTLGQPRSRQAPALRPEDEPIAGLECGLLGEKRSDLDMISFGPQIEGAHSPDERVSIPSVARFWGALTAVLARLS